MLESVRPAERPQADSRRGVLSGSPSACFTDGGESQAV